MSSHLAHAISLGSAADSAFHLGVRALSWYLTLTLRAGAERVTPAGDLVELPDDVSTSSTPVRIAPSALFTAQTFLHQAELWLNDVDPQSADAQALDSIISTVASMQESLATFDANATRLQAAGSAAPSSRRRGHGAASATQAAAPQHVDMMSAAARMGTLLQILQIQPAEMSSIRAEAARIAELLYKELGPPRLAIEHVVVANMTTAKAVAAQVAAEAGAGETAEVAWQPDEAHLSKLHDLSTRIIPETVPKSAAAAASPSKRAAPATPKSAARAGRATPASSSKKAGKKRTRHAWSSEEDARIAQGLHDFGYGKWKEIHDALFSDSERSACAIKDRARVMYARVDRMQDAQHVQQLDTEPVPAGGNAVPARAHGGAAAAAAAAATPAGAADAQQEEEDEEEHGRSWTDADTAKLIAAVRRYHGPRGIAQIVAEFPDHSQADISAKMLQYCGPDDFR